MARHFYLALLLLVLLCFAGTYRLEAQQVDLRKDAAFFRNKIPEFGLWLRQNQLDKVFRADSIAVTSGKVTLFLRGVYRGPRACDSLQSAWNKLESANRQVNGQFFRERLLHKWAFLAEVREDQAEVVVRCHQPAHFLARIYSQNGRVLNQGRDLRGAEVVKVNMPPSLGGANTGDNIAVINNKKVSLLCASARAFLARYYKPKGTPVLWKAHVDASYDASDEFIIEVTHLSYEICPDGFFEYHRIYVKGLQQGENVQLSWEFQGKYGSGIIFPPRKNDYKDMDLRYKTFLEDYQRRLFKQLLDYLRQ